MPSKVPRQASEGLDIAKIPYLMATLMGFPAALEHFPELAGRDKVDFVEHRPELARHEQSALLIVEGDSIEMTDRVAQS